MGHEFLDIKPLDLVCFKRRIGGKKRPEFSGGTKV